MLSVPNLSLSQVGDQFEEETKKGLYGPATKERVDCRILYICRVLIAV